MKIIYQLFLFYTVYVGFFHLGWSDGVYLRYGGKSSEDLLEDNINWEYMIFVLFQIIIGIIGVAFFFMHESNEQKLFVIITTFIFMIIVNGRNYLLLILQSINKIKEFSYVIIFNNLFFLFTLVISFILIDLNFKLIIVIDLFSKTLSFIYAIFLSYDFLKNTSYSKISLKRIIVNIQSGSQLMFANISSMLIVGVYRFFIEKGWDIITFGKVSLALSISKLLMTFTNSFALILFPILKNTPTSSLNIRFISIKSITHFVALLIPILYSPFALGINKWLVDYGLVSYYLIALLPVMVFELSAALVFNTFYKALRLENKLLKINIISVFLAILILFISQQFLKLEIQNLLYTIIIVAAIKNFLLEKHLNKIFKIKMDRKILMSILFVIVFIITNNVLSIYSASIIYVIIITVYFYYNKNHIKNSLINIRK